MRITHPDLEDAHHVSEGAFPGWEAVGWVKDETPESPAGTARPANRAAKTVWVDYAVEHGADRDAAEAMTRDELIDAYGG